jgi:hypothetical protein
MLAANIHGDFLFFPGWIIDGPNSLLIIPGVSAAYPYKRQGFGRAFFTTISDDNRGSSFILSGFLIDSSRQ